MLKVVPDQRLLSVVSNLCRERLQVICELTDGRRRRGTEDERVGGRNDPVGVRRQVNHRAAGALDLRKKSIKRKTKVRTATRWLSGIEPQDGKGVSLLLSMQEHSCSRGESCTRVGWTSTFVFGPFGTALGRIVAEVGSP